MALAELESPTVHVVSAYVPVELRERFARLAEQHERTVSGELRVAMKRHLEEHDIDDAGRDSEDR
jgi:hypothetical protein